MALAGIVLTNREHVMAAEPMGKILLGTILRYDYEVRDETELARSVPGPRIRRRSSSLLRTSWTPNFDPVRVMLSWPGVACTWVASV